MPPTPPDGFLAVPTSGKGRAVLILHPWWGLNDTIKAVCARMAEAGFIAFAPDLYHGRIATTIPEAEALSGDLDAERARAEVAAAARFVAEKAGSESPGLAVVGFSLGAYFALDLSATHPDLVRSVVVFYGTGPAEFGASKAAYLGHFAGTDPYEPAENVQALEADLRKAGRAVAFHTYPNTGHWFFEPDRGDAYDAKAAALAWDRTLDFLCGNTTP
jgi:carboxymethylenebutenolidase